jgi:hypothetical protein
MHVIIEQKPQGFLMDDTVLRSFKLPKEIRYSLNMYKLRTILQVYNKLEYIEEWENSRIKKINDKINYNI